VFDPFVCVFCKLAFGLFVHASYVSLCVKTMGVVVLQICWCVRRVRDSVGVCVSVTVCGHLCVSAVCVVIAWSLCVWS